jgi:phosphoribosylpyrophosphate synthetase
MIKYIKENFEVDDVVIVSPDAGGAKRYHGILNPVYPSLIFPTV